MESKIVIEECSSKGLQIRGEGYGSWIVPDENGKVSLDVVSQRIRRIIQCYKSDRWVENQDGMQIDEKIEE